MIHIPIIFTRGASFLLNPPILAYTSKNIAVVMKCSVVSVVPNWNSYVWKRVLFARTMRREERMLSVTHTLLMRLCDIGGW